MLAANLLPPGLNSTPLGLSLTLFGLSLTPFGLSLTPFELSLIPFGLSLSKSLSNPEQRQTSKPFDKLRANGVQASASQVLAANLLPPGLNSTPLGLSLTLFGLSLIPFGLSLSKSLSNPEQRQTSRPFDKLKANGAWLKASGIWIQAKIIY